MSEATEITAFNRSYVGRRADLLALVEGKPERVLDVGCALGASGGWLKSQHGCSVTGIEIDPKMAEAARSQLDHVHVADLNRTTLAELLGGQRFDLILMGDVLEHLVDPWTTLAHARELLTDDGRIITSLPNINHYTTLLSLIFMRHWPYRSRGIHDRTHLRFFTRSNLLELYAGAQLQIEHERRNLRILEIVSGINVLAKLFDFHPFRGYFTYQYVHCLRRSQVTSPR